MAEERLTLAGFIERRPFLGAFFRGKTPAERTNIFRRIGIETISWGFSMGLARIAAETIRLGLEEMMKVGR